jgi:hypothetical protein
MIARFWLALGAFATLWTVAYTVYHTHVRLSAGLAAVSWTVLAVTGGQVETLAQDGSRVDTGVPELQLVAALAALVSALVLLLYPDHYPVTKSEVPTDDTQTQ